MSLLDNYIVLICLFFDCANYSVNLFEITNVWSYLVFILY